MSDKVKYGSNFLDYKKVENEFATHLSKWLEWEDIAPERRLSIRKVASSFLKSWQTNGNFDPIAQTYTGNIEGNPEDIADVLRFVSEAISGRGLDHFKYQESEKPKEEEKSIALINYEKALKKLTELIEKLNNLLESNELPINKELSNELSTNENISEKEIESEEKPIIKPKLIRKVNNILSATQEGDYWDEGFGNNKSRYIFTNGLYQEIPIEFLNEEKITKIKDYLKKVYKNLYETKNIDNIIALLILEVNKDSKADNKFTTTDNYYKLRKLLHLTDESAHNLISEIFPNVKFKFKSSDPLSAEFYIHNMPKLRKEGGILKAQNGTPLWFKNRFKSQELRNWNSNLNKDLWITGGIRGKADSLDQPWETNYAYSQDVTALQNDLSNYYKNSTLDEQKALEEYNANVNKLNNFWGNTDVYYNQTVDINPIFAKLYASRHSDNPNYGLGYQLDLDTVLGSTTWNRRALAYENNLDKAFDFGARKVAFNKDGTIRFVDNIQSVPEILNPENVETHSYSDKKKDEEIPKLQKNPKNKINIGEIISKLMLYGNSSIKNKSIFNTLNKTPLYQMTLPPNITKKIYGNQRAIEEAQKAKGELKSEAFKAKTSDANLEAARLFLANYQGNQYLTQGFKEDDAMYRKTEAERQLQDEKNAMLNWQTVNLNLKYLNDWRQGKIKAKVDYLASQRESRDNLLKALETIYMNNRYDKLSKQEAAYSEYIKNYALRYPSATGLKEADIDILRKPTRTDQEERYYLEYILPTLQSWILSQKYGSIYYPNLPINKPGYYKVH